MTNQFNFNSNFLYFTGEKILKEKALLFEFNKVWAMNTTIKVWSSKARCVENCCLFISTPLLCIWSHLKGLLKALCMVVSIMLFPLEKWRVYSIYRAHGSKLISFWIFNQSCNKEGLSKWARMDNKEIGL